MDPSIKKHIEGMIKQYIVAAGNIPFTHEGFQAFVSERAKDNEGKPSLSPGGERTKAVAEYMKSNPAHFKQDTVDAFNKRLMEILQGLDNAASDSDNVSWAIKQIATSECMFDKSDKLSVRIRSTLNPAEVLDVKEDNLNANDNIGAVPKALPGTPKTAIGHVAHAVNAIDRAVTQAQHDTQNTGIGMLKNALGFSPGQVNNWLPVSPESDVFRQILYALRWTYSLRTQETQATSNGIDPLQTS